MQLFKRQRIRTPTIIQMEATECGAVSLAIIMSYYKHFPLIEEVRSACGVSRDGSKAINIVKAARDYGMISDGYILELDELEGFSVPCILHWEFNHFLVLEGIHKGKAYLNDPATGPRVVSMDEVDRCFTGLAITFEPGPNFVKKGKPEASILTMLWERLRKSELDFCYIVLVTMLLAIPSIAIPGFTKIFIDNILIRDQHNWIIPLLGGMLFTAVLTSVLTWLQQHYMLRFKMKLQLHGSSQFFWHLLHLPMRFFQQRSSGDLIERVETNDSVASLISSEITTGVIGALTMVLYALAILVLSWQLGVISIFITVINFFILIYVQRYCIDLGRRAAQTQGTLTGVEMNAMQIIETLKASMMENHFFDRWSGYHAKLINNEQRIEYLSIILEVMPGFLNGLNMVILLCLGSWYIMSGTLTVGTLVALQGLLVLFNAPLDDLIELANKIQGIKGEVVRLNDVLKSPAEHIMGTENAADSIEIAPSEPVLHMDSITFGYSNLEAPIFMNFSLSIKPGERIAVIGALGSGKSSLSRLICGLYKPWSGNLLICGKPLSAYKRSALANFIAMVDQEVFLFEGTVRDNLSLWDSTVSDQAMLAALKDACIDDIINERGGLNCYIAEAGRNFSGGQRQRLEIARALVKNPQFIILDEATSALDPILEKRIYSNLYHRNCAILVIAHRLSAIRDCDHIYVFDEGEIIENGTHDELVAQGKVYQRLVSME